MRLVSLLPALTLAPVLATAAVTEEEAKRLGQDLTPIGAERKGNADGTIPPWTGGILQPVPGHVPGRHYPNPYPDDPILFTIDASNVEQHAEHLSLGQRALIEKYPDSFVMHVYPTRRSASYPERVYASVKKNALSARLSPSGKGVTGIRGSFPFPIPASGLELILNHIARFRTHAFDWDTVTLLTTRGGGYIPMRVRRIGYTPWDVPFHNTGAPDIPANYFYYREHTTRPAHLAGRIFLAHEPLNLDRDSRGIWTYAPGERRVRRAANLSGDTSYAHVDALITVDDFDMFNGPPQAFRWRLIGKRELYIPYNDYALLSNLAYEELVKRGHISQVNVRYEKHRVWAVEARLKENQSHIYNRRIFYVDEDSWQISIAETYDAGDELWRLGVIHPVNYYDVPLHYIGIEVHFDLQIERFVAFYLGDANGEGRRIRFNTELSLQDFTPSAIRRLGRR